MNHKQQIAAMHARELRVAKDDLLIKINSYIQQVRSQGGTAEITPQLERLVTLDKYRARDVAKIQQLVSNPDRLQEYIYAENAQGQSISGEKALTRYRKALESGFVRPAKESEIVIDNFKDTVRDMFVDMSVFNEFERKLNALVQQDINEPTEEQWMFARGNYLARLHNSKEIIASKQWFMWQNRDNIRDIEHAFNSALRELGEKEAAQRILNAGQAILENAIYAAIGYNEQAGHSVQAVLRVFHPSATRKMAVDLQEAYESQYGEEEW